MLGRATHRTLFLLDGAAAVFRAGDSRDVAQIDACLATVFTNHAELRARWSPRSQEDGWFIVPAVARDVVLSVILDAWDELEDSRKEADRSLAFLHGHIGMTPTSKPDLVGMRLGRDYREVRSDRIEAMVDHRRAFAIGAEGIHHNSVMITGLAKSDAFGREPFSTYFHALSRDLRSADRILVVGTSLSDDHVNTLLNGWWGSRPEPRAILADLVPVADRRDEAGKPKPSELAAFFVSTIGARFPTMNHPGERAAKGIAERGYASIASGVVFFARGTKELYEVGSTNDVFDALIE